MIYYILYCGLLILFILFGIESWEPARYFTNSRYCLLSSHPNQTKTKSSLQIFSEVLPAAALSKWKELIWMKMWKRWMLLYVVVLIIPTDLHFYRLFWVHCSAYRSDARADSVDKSRLCTWAWPWPSQVS